jgi:phosphoglycolate phosphatase
MMPDNINMQKYKAIVFDLDGTLLNTLSDIGNAVNRVLSGHHFPIHPIDSYRYFVGDGVKTLLIRALPADQQSEPLIQICMAEFNREYARSWKNETTLYPGVSEMLDRLHSLGLKLAVLSNKPQEFTQYCVDGFLSKWKFEAVSGSHASLPYKPDPTGALAIAGRMGISPASFLYLGDTGVDMQTACAAGMYPVGALWGFRSSTELSAAGAKALVNHPSEVAGILESQG